MRDRKRNSVRENVRSVCAHCISFNQAVISLLYTHGRCRNIEKNYPSELLRFSPSRDTNVYCEQVSVYLLEFSCFDNMISVQSSYKFYPMSPIQSIYSELFEIFIRNVRLLILKLNSVDL